MRSKIAVFDLVSGSYKINPAHFIGKSFNMVCNILDITETELKLHFYNQRLDIKYDSNLEKIHWDICHQFFTLKYNEKMSRLQKVRNSVDLPCATKYTRKYGTSKGKEGNYYRLFHGGHPKS